MKHNISLYGIVIIYAVMFSACSDDLKNELGFGHEIAFEIEPSSTVTTRSATEDEEIEPQRCITETADTFYLHTYVTNINDSILQPKATTRGAQKDVSNLQSDGFNVSAYNTSDGTTKGSAYFEFLTATYAASKFTPQSAGNKKYWPAGKLMFYAYYPAATVSNGITQGSDATTLTYSVPSTPANHPDLMTAKLDNQQYSSGDGTSSLTFNHALCAIKFQTGTDIAGGTINSITFNNIYTSGTYNLDTQTWDFTGKSRGNVSFTGLDVATTEGTANTAIISGDNTLMMIPQSFDNNNQTITISLTDANSVQHTLNYILNGTSWTQGQCITYTISATDLVWEYVLEATANEISYTGGNMSFNVKSYRYLRTTPTTIEPVAWSINGYKTSGDPDFSETKPTWTTSITTSGSGTSTVNATESGTATFTAQSSTTAMASFTDLTLGTSENPYDLSTQGGNTTRNTANCYIVNAPGWYKIPLVYGNGIKNGTKNTAAYNSNSFVDYNGTKISTLSGPYLKYSGTIGTSGSGAPAIVWQDVQGMVSNISVVDATTEDGYLKFYIASAKIAQGNAVIAVKNSSGTIMWNWHIWVTGTDVSQTTKVTSNNTSYSYYIMPSNLGWVSYASTTYYSRRWVTIRLVQNISGKTLQKTLVQKMHSIPSHLGDNTFYQHGRKDPFPGGFCGTATSRSRNSANNTQKPAWNNSGTSYTVDFSESSNSSLPNLKTTIRNPNKWYGLDNNWVDTYYMDLWEVGNTSEDRSYNKPVKSIYDPNPLGFVMPPAYTFWGLTKTNVSNEDNSANIKGTFDDDETKGRGWDYYTDPDKQHFFIPCSGHIRRAGYLVDPSAGSCIWYARVMANRAAHYFYCNNGKCGPGHGLDLAAAQSVRPIVE